MSGYLVQGGVTPDDSVSTAKIQDDAVTLAKLAAGTDGNIISYDASGNPVAIATGNDGQVLTSAGAGQPPAFEAAGGGAWGVLSSGTFTGVTEIDFTSITKSIKIFLSNVRAATPANIALRCSTDGGSSFNDGAGDYIYAYTNVNSNGADWVITLSTGASSFELPRCENQSDFGSTMEITILSPQDATHTQLHVAGVGQASSSTTIRNTISAGSCIEAENTDAIRILNVNGGGNISGTYVVAELN